jgi:hypothetical protein
MPVPGEWPRLLPEGRPGSGNTTAGTRMRWFWTSAVTHNTYPFSILSSWKPLQELRAAGALPQVAESKRIEFGRLTLTRVQWHGRAGAGHTGPGASSGRRVRDR